MCDHIQKLRRTSGDGGVITDRYADTFSCGSLQMESSKDRRVESGKAGSILQDEMKKYAKS